MSTAPFPLMTDADTRDQSTEARASQGGTRPSGDNRPQAGRLRRLRRLLGASYRDSLFERHDLIEDDYYRLINQPRGW